MIVAHFLIGGEEYPGLGLHLSKFLATGGPKASWGTHIIVNNLLKWTFNGTFNVKFSSTWWQWLKRLSLFFLLLLLVSQLSLSTLTLSSWLHFLQPPLLFPLLISSSLNTNPFMPQVPVPPRASGPFRGGEGGLPGCLQLHRGAQIIGFQPLWCHLRPPWAVCPRRGSSWYKQHRLMTSLLPPIPTSSLAVDIFNLVTLFITKSYPVRKGGVLRGWTSEDFNKRKVPKLIYSTQGWNISNIHFWFFSF